MKNTKSYKSINNNDFSGLYIFYSHGKPIYVGISGTVIRRLKYHLFGQKDNESSFVYLMARKQHENEIGKKYTGKRSDFVFDDYRDEIQKEMKEKWSFKYIQIENGYFLSFIEIYIACALETNWNTFKTH